jgi:hypothetical protein
MQSRRMSLVESVTASLTGGMVSWAVNSWVTGSLMSGAALTGSLMLVSVGLKFGWRRFFTYLERIGVQ